MRAIVLDEKGGPEVLRVREIPDPAIGPDEVLVDVVSTAVNRAEVLQRMGLYPQPAPAPKFEIPGLEFAGRVVALGERVIAWNVGDEVMGIVSGGGYASRVAVHERQAIRIPSSVSVHDAGSIPEVWITAFDALVAQGGLALGGAVLIHAGGSGVGTAAIQIAKALDATVIVTASASKCARCVDLGADRAVDYATDDFVEIAREATGGRGVDVVLDVIGGDYVDRNVDALAMKGTIMQVGTMASGSATVTVAKLMGKRARIVGTMLRARPIDEKIAISQRFAREIVPGFDDARFAPVIDARFSLEDMADAHRMMEANANFGKIAIDVQPAA
ncbi:MAG: NAD(P)H-quinone oxidoreductase [Actinobacteria bacterium]|nr:MAG: NAD(P)H-quinone oxidoreductase [Actinomycetota bacterium]